MRSIWIKRTDIGDFGEKRADIKTDKKRVAIKHTANRYRTNIKTFTKNKINGHGEFKNLFLVACTIERWVTIR